MIRRRRGDVDERVGVVPLHGWWTTPELAYHLSVSARHLERLRARGDGPPWFRVGRFVRYDVAQIERWLEERTVPALPPPGAMRRRAVLHLVVPERDDGA